MWIRYEVKCPRNLKCPEGRKGFTETKCPVPNRKEKEGGEKEKTGLEGWVSTG
jgi:hypothetical protein